MSNTTASAKSLSVRLLESAQTFLKRLPQMLVLWVAVAVTLALVATVLPGVAHLSSTIDSNRQTAAHFTVEMREPEPIKCFRAVAWDVVFFGTVPRQRAMDQHDNLHVTREKIPRVEGERYPCPDRNFDAYYVEPPAPSTPAANKN